MQTDTMLLLAVPNLANPATPWVILVLVTAGWLAAYLFVSTGSRS